MYQLNSAPVGVGGVGGSGTRMVADLIDAMGIYMGQRYVNESNDNIAWKLCQDMLGKGNPQDERARREIIFRHIAQFEREMHSDFENHRTSQRNWFWKVPTTFFFLEYLAEYFPRMRYVHVIRHGLDMTFSKNARQVVKWAGFFGIPFAPPKIPKAHLRYWIKVNQRIRPELSRARLQYWIRANQYAVAQAERLLPDRYLLLRFDDLCREPDKTLPKLAEFLEVPPPTLDLRKLHRLIKVPSTVGRYKQKNYQRIFSPEMIEAVVRFGFAVE
jgi:hypothetical protein